MWEITCAYLHMCIALANHSPVDQRNIVKIIEMANQMKVDGIYCSQKQSLNSSAKCLFNVEMEWGKMEAAIIYY